jgi:tRNA-dihydrouridine synthase 3
MSVESTIPPLPYPVGTAPVKSEQVSRFPRRNNLTVRPRFLISVAKPGTVADDDAAEGSTTGDRGQHRDARDSRDSRGSGGRSGKMTKEQKKAQRGQNKARKFGKVRDDFDLCWKIANGSVCEFGDELSILKPFVFGS